jgi:hypothetical protein
LEKPQAVKSVTISPTGEIAFSFVDPTAKIVSGWVSTHRVRAKGDKTLTKIPISAAALQIGDAAALLQYDHIFGIDTNTISIGDRRVSISHVAELRFRRSDEQISAEYASLGGFEFHNPKQPPENLGWSALQNAVVQSNEFETTKRYAIVTDSDLGNHGDYNKYTKPICGDEFLRRGFTLIYSADEGRSITNELIGYCDKTSTETLKEVANGTFPVEQALEIASPHFTHFRGWFNSNPDVQSKGWFVLAQIAPKTS